MARMKHVEALPVIAGLLPLDNMNLHQRKEPPLGDQKFEDDLLTNGSYFRNRSNQDTL